MMLFLCYYSERQILQGYDASSGLSQASALGTMLPQDTEHLFHGRIHTVQCIIPAFCGGGFGLDRGSVSRFAEKNKGVFAGGEYISQINGQEKKGEMETQEEGEPGWLFGVTVRDRPRDGRARSWLNQGQLHSLQCHQLVRARFWSYQTEAEKGFVGKKGEVVE